MQTTTLVTRLLALAVGFAAVACDGGSPEGLTSPDGGRVTEMTVTASKTALRFSPYEYPIVSLFIPNTTELVAMAGTEAGARNVSAEASWSSSNPAVATVTSQGSSGATVTATGIGNAIISARYQGVTATVQLAVTSVVTGLSISGNTAYLFSAASASRQTGQLQATATLDYGQFTTAGATTMVAWKSSNPAAVIVSSGGMLTAVGVGQSMISASFQGYTATVQSVVSGEPLHLSGTFRGQVDYGVMNLVLTQTGSAISGYGNLPHGLGLNGPVLVTGSVNGLTVELIPRDNGGSCPVTYTLTISTATNNFLAGRFTKNGWCNGAFASSNFALTRQ